MRTVSSLTMVLLLLSCYSREPERTGLEGKPLPAFDLLLADSTTHYNTSSIPAGKPIVLFFFGPRCPYSKAQMDEIIKNINQLSDIQFYVITTYSFMEMKEFYEHYHLNNYKNIIVGIDYSDFFPSYYNVPGVPYTAIFGKDRRLRKAFIGKVNGRQIKETAAE